jgi:hypothetical protein
MKVFVYFNLHKRCFSVKALEGQAKGLVIAYANDVVLFDPVFKVSKAGRDRVLRERKKNVHAGVIGDWDPAQYKPARTVELWATGGREVTYNPYKYEQFVYKNTETPVDNQPRYAGLHSDGQRATMWALK